MRARELAPAADALELLSLQGGPFDHPDVRAALAAAFPGWREASFGTRFADGTLAAIALLCDGARAVSLPFNYGGVHATRGLDGRELRALLDAARRSAGAHTIVVRTVVPGTPGGHDRHFGGRVVGWTSVVRIDTTGDIEARATRLARKAIRRARERGAAAALSGSPEGFLALYRTGSEAHWLRYPEGLVRDLVHHDRAMCFDVRLGNRVISSVLALKGASHWIAWLAAQDEAGRAIGANYLATATLLAHAQAAHVRAVDLGSSTGTPGVALFKRRFGAFDVAVHEFRQSSPRGLAAAQTAIARERLVRAGRRARRRALRRARSTAGGRAKAPAAIASTRAAALRRAPAG